MLFDIYKDWHDPIAFAIAAQLAISFGSARVQCQSFMHKDNRIPHKLPPSTDHMRRDCQLYTVCARVCISITKRFTESLLKSDYTTHHLFG